MNPRNLPQGERGIIMSDTVLIQQCKKEGDFKLFELSNGKDYPTMTPIGFPGLETDYPELSKYVVKKGSDMVFHSKNLVRDGVPLDIVDALHKVYKFPTVFFSNNHCAGMVENISNISKEYAISR